MLSCKLDPRSEQQATALYTYGYVFSGPIKHWRCFQWGQGRYHWFHIPLDILSRFLYVSFPGWEGKAELRATPLTNAKPLHHVLLWGWWDVKCGHRFEWTNAWRNILYPRLGMDTLLVSNDGATWIVFIRFSMCCLSANVGLSDTLHT